MDTIGHNALAGLTYFLTFLAFLFQAATGFGSYSAMSDAWLPRLFAWVVPLHGGRVSPSASGTTCSCGSSSSSP